MFRLVVGGWREGCTVFDELDALSDGTCCVYGVAEHTAGKVMCWSGELKCAHLIPAIQLVAGEVVAQLRYANLVFFYVLANRAPQCDHVPVMVQVFLKHRPPSRNSSSEDPIIPNARPCKM